MDLIHAGKFDEARQTFQRALKERPKSGWELHGIALAWDKQGKATEAAAAYKKFLSTWSHADPDLPQVKAAHAYVAGQAQTAMR